MNATLPDMCHLKRSHAQDLATAIIGFLREWPTSVTVYLNGAGEFALLIGCISPVPPDALVGTYTAASARDDIAADIIASQRERVHG